MPLGEFIGEVILRTFLEPVFYGLAYGAGFLVIKAVTFGGIRLAPLMTISQKNRNKRRWYQIDWSIWLHQPLTGRELKAECTCLVGLVGLVVWASVGAIIYQAVCAT